VCQQSWVPPPAAKLEASLTPAGNLFKNCIEIFIFSLKKNAAHVEKSLDPRSIPLSRAGLPG
jgi:hypothetical protein